MGDANGKNGKDLGIRPIGPGAGGQARVNLRIPPIEGFDPQVLVAIVQQTMVGLHPYAPLLPPQDLADAACAVIGDLRALPAVEEILREAPPGYRWRLEIIRPMRVQIGSDDLAEVELVLEAPCRLADCRTTSDLASLATMVGYLTSPIMRGLFWLEGRRARITPPFLVEQSDETDDQTS